MRSSLSAGLMIAMGIMTCEAAPGYVAGQAPGATLYRYDVSAGQEPPPGFLGDPYAVRSLLEDWAEAFATYIYPHDYHALRHRRYISIGPMRELYARTRLEQLR